MATEREKKYARIKEVVAEANGNLQVAGPMLDISPKALSATLCSGLRSWWSVFKRKKVRENDLARRRRWYANRQRRALEAAGLDPDSFKPHKSS